MRTLAPCAFAAVSLVASRAGAVDCTTLPSPVYAGGSTAIVPVMGKIGQFLAAQTPPATLVYAQIGSCAGITQMVATVNSPPTTLFTPMTKSNFFNYWDLNGNLLTCDITAPMLDGGAPVCSASTPCLDVALSDVFPATCQSFPAGLPGGIQDHPGPVQAMTFVVPSSSTQYSISSEAAYFVFGFGNNSGVSPWSKAASLIQRSVTSGTQNMIATAIGVPASRWYGVFHSKTSDVYTALQTANAQNDGAALGIMAAEDVDAYRLSKVTVDGGVAPDILRELAYQHKGQLCGYLPDSAPDLFDKRNVRDGHYAIWGPVHVLPTGVSPAGGNSTNVSLIVNVLQGTMPLGSTDLVATEAKLGIIPQCAMRVQRSSEVGSMMPASPTSPCGCYYEEIANQQVGKHSTCKTCTTVKDCPTMSYSCPQYASLGVGFCEPP
jgi:hypothetical protein